ncbi:MAG: hypothetical protein JOZ17_05015 [Acetobacteraceae bacterium]|jgi:hypothetical protein|nr:hypothetical protein [Acetobacteraceae bacterium]
MCALCGVLGVEHWADRTNGIGPMHRQARLRRASLLSDVLSFYRIHVDDWQGITMALRGPTGRTELADTLADLWPKAEAIAGRPLDPLDPALLAHIDGVRRGDRA